MTSWEGEPAARLSLQEKRRKQEQRIITGKRRCGKHKTRRLVLQYLQLSLCTHQAYRSRRTGVPAVENPAPENSRSRSAGPFVGGCGKPHLSRGSSLYRSDSVRVLRSVLKSPSRCRRSSIFRIEWMTVEWCFPPKLLPISGSEAFVRFLQRYIAICRGMATDFELLRDFSSAGFSP